MEKPEQAFKVYGWQIRHISRGCDVDRTKVGKLTDRLPRKAAIVLLHPKQWMHEHKSQRHTRKRNISPTNI